MFWQYVWESQVKILYFHVIIQSVKNTASIVFFIDIYFAVSAFICTVLVRERTRTEVGSRKDHETEIKPGLPHAQPNHVSEHCPRVYRLRHLHSFFYFPCVCVSCKICNSSSSGGSSLPSLLTRLLSAGSCCTRINLLWFYILVSVWIIL